VCALALLLGATIGSGQYLESVIELPDTLGPLNGPYHLACTDDPAFPRLYIGGEADSGGIIVADAITCKRLARIPAGRVRTLCYVQPHNKLYVSRLGWADSVWVVDCATNQIVKAAYVPGPIAAMQYNSQNDKLYCGGNSVSAIDCAADTVVHTIAVAASSFALDSTNSKLYAGGDGPLSVIDCAVDSVVASIPEIDSAGALCFNVTAQKVYVASGDTLYAIQTSRDSIVARLPFAGLAPVLTCDAQRNRMYCAHGGSWSSIDCVSDSVIRTFGTNVTARFMACDVARDRLYWTSLEMAVFDASTGQLLARTWLDGAPSGASWCPGLDRLYCLPGFRLLTAVSGANDSIVGIVPLTMYASSLCVDSLDNKLYFLYSSTGGCIGVVDCSRNVVTSYMYAGVNPMAMCYNANNGRLYSGTHAWTSAPGAITVFDCSADTLVKRIPTSSSAEILRLHPTLNKLYVASSYYPDFLDVIDCSTDSITNRISLPGDNLHAALLVPEDNRLWHLGTSHVVAIDCLGDSVVADAIDHLGSIDDACACPEDRKIYTSDGDVIDMDNPASVTSVPFWASRFCYVASAHKLYGVGGGSSFVVWDTQGDTALATFNRPCGVSGMCLDHTGDYIYCAGYGSATMLVIGVREDSVVAEVSVPVTAAARGPLAVNTRTHRIYEAEYDYRPAGRIPVIHDSMLIGLEELVPTERKSGVSPTMVSRNAPLRTATMAELHDASGRRVAVLRQGPNDISQLVPGVYFVRQEPQAASRKPQAVRKIVVAR
jgi:DNA-binding beta-propeller fold protein YncE